MWTVGRGVVAAAVLAVGLAAGPAVGDNNPNGAAFRAVGWFKGKAEISDTNIQCEIPNISSAIADGLFAMGIWNTFGRPNLYFPDINGPFSNPCGGWIELANNLIDQGLQLDHVDLRYRIPIARRLRQFAPARNGFPAACRQLRRDTLFVGTVINPVNSTVDTSGSGAPNVAFVQVLPLVSTQMFDCLRSQYASIPPSVLISLPLVIHATAVAVSDAGDTFRSNPIQYTLNLRHTCGNGRLDDVEECDGSAPVDLCKGCVAGFCTFGGNPCISSFDCPAACVPPGGPSECSCTAEAVPTTTTSITTTTTSSVTTTT
jgi:hypothetical protein